MKGFSKKMVAALAVAGMVAATGCAGTDERPERPEREEQQADDVTVHDDGTQQEEVLDDGLNGTQQGEPADQGLEEPSSDFGTDEPLDGSQQGEDLSDPTIDEPVVEPLDETQQSGESEEDRRRRQGQPGGLDPGSEELTPDPGVGTGGSGADSGTGM